MIKVYSWSVVRIHEPFKPVNKEAKTGSSSAEDWGLDDDDWSADEGQRQYLSLSVAVL